MESYPSIRIAYGMQSDRSVRSASYWPFTNRQGQATNEDASGTPYAGADSPYLSHAVNPGDGSLADRIFGRQLAEKSVLLEQSERLAGDRRRIHYARLSEINDMRDDFRNRLAFLHRPYCTIPSSQAAMLERLLLQLESERHREECAFWKDMAEVQHEFIESALAYHAARERHDLLGALESANG
ncbi:MAG: hypothetical protein NTW86_09960 [Candidatus Sumerlaeota bacterium]|nr:hypothetical protein [Candidatus Sumerlaeota bacterium]